MNQPAELPTRYVPAEVEATLYSSWVDAGYFEVDPASDKPPFAIVIPPPNVTGVLHIGHALDHTIQDILVRRRRMQGYEALWLPGMDHAGIATQNVVERELAKDGLSRHDLGRDAFVAKVWDWKAESGGKILSQMRRLGDSVAWDRERFTMDTGLSRAVLTMFKRLFDDGLIYRAERIINWCPRCHTALSDIEVEHSEDAGELVSIRYGDGDAQITVATTRAETMLGDTAVAVHPDDERYAHLIGTTVPLPLTDRQIPIVADEHVDPAFGTGAVKVTPAHDPNDFAIGARHNLPSITILDETGVVTAHGPFLGLDRFEARPAVVAALRAQGRIVAEKRPYLHSVGHCSRCKTVVEPRLSLQWFVNVAPLAKAAGDAVRDGRVAIHPKELEPRYFAWVDNMHDWCISRQLWWGHRIPVWYGPDGEVRCIGPDEAAPAGAGWTQDPDVLDTWFSSGLWPFSTLGWPDRTPELAKFYPTSVLVTGYDILFFWVARMMMFGLYAMKDDAPSGDVPFGTVALHGMVRDQFGKKMSKSSGNVVDPLNWIERFGADALRLTLARGANPGADVPVSEDWVQGSRNFCNKLWNATRFALLNGASVARGVPAREALSPADRWILSRVHATLAQVDAYYEDYEFAKATEALYHLVWDEFCDWYLELAKAPLARGGAEAEATSAVLGHCLDVLLKALHPVIPFVTEALWTTLTGGESVVIAPWPSAEAAYADADAEAQIAAVQEHITEIRRFRADQGVPPAKKIPARIQPYAEVVGIAEHVGQIRALTRLVAAEADFSAGATLQLKGATVELDLSGLIDVAAERARLEKDLAAAQGEITAAEVKLSNPEFTAKAPDKVVAKITDRRTSAQADVARISAQLGALA
ncbi:MAG: valine--tRNA ligase [Sporichthyaceae bacterium]